MIKVQSDDFSVEKETKILLNKNNNVGAISSFIGIVRNKAKEKDLISMTLDHYPGMTEKMLQKIEDEALSRWNLLDSLIIHRHGELFPGENTFKSKEEVPLIYVKFLTDEPVVLKKFFLTPELIELTNSCTHLKRFKAFKSLNKLYNIFTRSLLQKKILKEIQKNVIDD